MSTLGRYLKKQKQKNKPKDLVTYLGFLKEFSISVFLVLIPFMIENSFLCKPETCQSLEVMRISKCFCNIYDVFKNLYSHTLNNYNNFQFDFLTSVVTALQQYIVLFFC